jgi:hypothetical protein
VWSRVKPLFSRRTEAFSLEKFIELWFGWVSNFGHICTLFC